MTNVEATQQSANVLTVLANVFQAVTNANQFWDFMVKVCDHLPFLAATSFFRISAITLCLTYINIWAILPIALYWMSNLFVGYRKYVMAKSEISASILNNITSIQEEK